MSGTRNALAVAFSRHFMAVSLLKMHQIFMLAFAGLRVEGGVAQVLVVSQPPPLAFLVFLLSFPPGRRPLMGRRPRRRLNGSHTIPQLLHELVVAIGFQYVIQMRNFWGAECFLGDIMHPHLLLLAFQWFCVKPL